MQPEVRAGARVRPRVHGGHGGLLVLVTRQILKIDKFDISLGFRQFPPGRGSGGALQAKATMQAEAQEKAAPFHSI